VAPKKVQARIASKPKAKVVKKIGTLDAASITAPHTYSISSAGQPKGMPEACQRYPVVDFLVL
jgi:hypothetical protein